MTRFFLITLLVAGTGVGSIALAKDVGTDEMKLAEKALKLIDEARKSEPVAHPAYREIFTELLRLENLPFVINPKLESLEWIDKADRPVGLSWPPHLSDLKDLLLSQVIGPGKKKGFNQDLLSRMYTLLRVENEIQRLPPEQNYRKLGDLTFAMRMMEIQGNRVLAARIGKKIESLKENLENKRQEILLRITQDDIEFLLRTGTPTGIDVKHSLFAKSRIYFPGKMAPDLLAATPANRLRLEGNGSVSLSLQQARELLQKNGLAPQTLLDISRVVNGNIRLQLPNEMLTQRNADNLLRDLQIKSALENNKPLPKRSQLFAGPGPSCSPGTIINPQLQPYYRLPPAKDSETNGATNACFTDTRNPVNTNGADLGNLRQAQSLKNESPDSFKMEMRTKSGDRKNQISACMLSIVDPAAAKGSGENRDKDFPPSPEHAGFRRVVALTATHCVKDSDDLESINLVGYSHVPRRDIHLEPLAGSDFTMMVMDVPNFDALELSAHQSKSFVALPPRDLEVGERGVVADVNIRENQMRDRNAGSTFAVPGASNEVGLNFKNFNNHGIFPGDSGGGVVAIVNGKKTWLGAMSYKCVGVPFEDGVGAMASGKQVFGFIQDNLPNALKMKLNNDESYIAHQKFDHQDGDGTFDYKPIHAGVR